MEDIDQKPLISPSLMRTMETREDPHQIINLNMLLSTDAKLELLIHNLN